MGEYAKRLSDGEKVKLGTCEEMFYCRWEQRLDVQKLPNNLDPANTPGLFWRLPFPDEDGVRVGEFKDYNRGLRLYARRPGDDRYFDAFEQVCGPLPGEPGIVQLHHECGLLVNVPCHHGQKLPEAAPDGWGMFWNGRSWFLELNAVKNLHPCGSLVPVVHCRFCRRAWSFDWSEVLPYVGDAEMRRRLEVYA